LRADAPPEVGFSDAECPVHAGRGFWDFVTLHNLDANDPVGTEAHRLALEKYRRDLAEYRVKKAAADVIVDLVRS
jgi:hypothetical protein